MFLVIDHAIQEYKEDRFLSLYVQEAQFNCHRKFYTYEPDKY